MGGNPEYNYVIWNVERNMWWGDNKQGYAKTLECAGQYTREVAVELVAEGRVGVAGNDVQDILVRYEDAALSSFDGTVEFIADGA